MTTANPGTRRQWISLGAAIGAGTTLLTSAVLLVQLAVLAGGSFGFLAVVIGMWLAGAATQVVVTVPLGIGMALVARVVATRLPDRKVEHGRGALAAYFGLAFGAVALLAYREPILGVIAMSSAAVTSLIAYPRVFGRAPRGDGSDPSSPPLESIASDRTAYRHGTKRRVVISWILRALVIAAVIGAVAAVPAFGGNFLMGGPLVLYPTLIVSIAAWVPLAAAFALAGALFGWLLTLDDSPMVPVSLISAIYFGLVGLAAAALLDQPLFGGAATVALLGSAIGSLVSLKGMTPPESATD